MIPTIAEAAIQFAAGTLSPVELTRQCLARVAQHGALHAFIRLTEDTALQAARESEARWRTGTPRGPLDGIPIGHKDIYNTAGIATTAHSRLLEHNVPDTDAVVVSKLAEAGTVMLGKLATHEFAFGGPSFDLPWPPARNPWDISRFTGGSSSGTGAAVAAGLVLGGTGSDTGGSIRSPAGFCGVAGIKPTYGLVSRRGILPLSFSLDHAGPLAWTVRDCALLLAAMAGHDPSDPASAAARIPDYQATIDDGVRGLRIGVVRHWHERDVTVSDATARGIDVALEVFRNAGAEIGDVTLAPLADYQAAGYLILLSEAYAVHEEWMRTEFNRYGEKLRHRMALGALVTGADYVQATRRRRELCLQMTAAMGDIDILLTATQPAEAPPIDAVTTWANHERPPLTMPGNVTGQPAMSICSGFGEGGLPVSIQLMGRPFEEATVFRAAQAFEAATPWREKRPR